MFSQEMEKKNFTDIGGNLIIKWRVEPIKVPFSDAAGFCVERMLVKPKSSDALGSLC